MFIEQLREIKLHLPLDLGLPVNLSGSGVSELLRLAKVNIVYVKNILTFIIEIPLINNFEFILYKFIYSTVKLNIDVYLVIEPTSEYIAIDKPRLHFIKLNPFQLSQCKTTIDSIICYHEQPIRNVKESCEIMLFLSPKNIPEICNVKYIHFNHSIWHKIENTNNWLYLLNKENMLVTCQNITEPINVQIYGTDIFKLDIYCEANTIDGDVTLKPNRKIVSKMLLNYIPKLNISMDFEKVWINLINKEMKHSEIIKQNPDTKHYLNKLAKIAKSINLLRKLPIKETENMMNISYSYINVIMVILIISVGLSILAFYFKINHISCSKIKQIETVEIYN